MTTEGRSNLTSESALFPLTLVAEGETVRIAGVAAGKGADRRLRDLGLIAGATVTVVHREDGGPILLAHGETRVGIGFGLAHRVMVSATGGENQ